MNLVLADLDLPIRIRTDRQMTDEELLRFCAENEPMRVELDSNGELIVVSPTGTGGGSIETDVAIELGIWARADGRGRVVGSNTGVILADNSVRAADAAWVSWSRWNPANPLSHRSFVRLCPEFVVEIRSNSGQFAAVQAKMNISISNGVQLAWLIDPKPKVVEIYRNREAAEIHQNSTSVQGVGPVRGFELVMEKVWS